MQRIRADDVIRVGILILILLVLLTLLGCTAGQPLPGQRTFFGIPIGTPDRLLTTDDVAAALRPLHWTATLCLPLGVVVLFITRGKRGWWFIGMGVGLSILSWLLALMKPWVMLIVAPLIIVLIVWYAYTMFTKLRGNGGLLHYWRKPKEVTDDPVPG